MLIFLPSNSFLSFRFRRCLSCLLVKSVLIRAAPNHNHFSQYFYGCRGSVSFWDFFLVHPFVSGSIYFLWILHLCVLSLQAQIILSGHFSLNFFSREKTFGVILMARILKNHPLLTNLRMLGLLLHGLCLMHASCLGFLVQWSLILSPTCGPIAPLNLCALI